MLQLLALVIVAFPGDTPIEARHQDSVQLLKCGFEEEDDRNLDGWPDLWTRQVGPGFPHYIAIHVSQEPSAAGERSVRFDLNGGAAAIHSRAIEIDASHDYVLEGFMKTDGLVGDEAFYSVAFLDANKRQLEIHLTLSILNPFRQVVSGKLKVELPEGWKASPSEFDLRLGPGESAQRLLEVVIPQLASFGRHRLRFDFDLTADHPYQFSLYRNIDVGLGDLVMEVSTHLNAAGEMEVEQRLANRTNRQMSFRCHLSAPNRRRVRKQVLRLGQGEDIQTYRLPAGADLAGQLLSIRAEEIGGQKRILNYTFTAEP